MPAVADLGTGVVRDYIIRRLGFMLVTLLAITLVSYAMMRLAPGDPIRSQLVGGGAEQGVRSQDRDQSRIEEMLRAKYHLDKPIVVGYAYWLHGVATRFDFGTSIVYDRGAPVTRVILERLPITLRLNLWSLLLVYLLAVPIGIYSAVRRNHWTERILSVGLFLLYSLPSFWVGLLLLLFFASDRFFDFFPVTGIEPPAAATWGRSTWAILGLRARHYVLPVICLSYGGLAGLSRYARVGLLEVLGQDYVRTARAKGVGETRVVLVHALRNGMIPLITLFAGLLPGLVAGSVVVEYIFSIEGMGSLALQALGSRDYPLMMAIFTMGSCLTLVGILFSDLCYAFVDPRIHYD
jgi:peptide/nickel transport system permease protein